MVKEKTPRKEETKKPVITISFKDADGYTKTDQQILLEELSRKDLLSEGYGYSAFPPTRVASVLKHGSYRHGDLNPTDIFCCLVSEEAEGTKITDQGDFNDLIHYLYHRADEETPFAALQYMI